MNTRTAAALLLSALTTVTLTACDDGSDKAADKPAAPAASSPAGEESTQKQRDEAAKSAGIPKEPTGQKRQNLLDALAAVAPDVVRHEDKAIDAAQNQCSAITGKANKLNWLASQRFTYKDVTTSEAQGAKLNTVLRDSGFCNV